MKKVKNVKIFDKQILSNGYSGTFKIVTNITKGNNRGTIKVTSIAVSFSQGILERVGSSFSNDIDLFQ